MVGRGSWSLLDNQDIEKQGFKSEIFNNRDDNSLQFLDKPILLIPK